jgi:Cu2+-exporting ATPase
MLKCDHCLLTFPDHDAIYDEIGGEKKVFCCSGCRGIYRLIREEGLDKFYKERKWDEAGIAQALLTKEIDLRPFAENVRDDDDKKEVDIFIGNIRCASCVWLNEKILNRTEGVEYARVNYATHMAKIRWNPAVTGLDRILKRIASIGYNPKPYSESEQFRAQKAEARDLLIRFGTAGFLSSQLMIYSIALYAGYFHGIDAHTKLILEIIAGLLTAPVIFYSGMPFIKNTIAGLRHLRFNMDSLITIGSGSAFAYSIYQTAAEGPQAKVYFDTSAMIITLILLGRYIEVTAKGRASETIERLTELTPKEARRVKGQDIETVPVSSVNKGDFIQVRPGERIPLDGIVMSGESEADEAIITGESRPVSKKQGSEVIGGTMNLYGSLIFEVTRTGKDTVLSGIIRAVEDAQARKPEIQRLADRITGFFVPAILLTALATVAFYMLKGMPSHFALMTGISVLVIACPCSLGLATPIAVLIFTTMSSSKGVLIRGGEVVENSGRLTHAVFDKTGTITAGKPALKEVIVFSNDMNKEDLLFFAASIESLSEHSIGHAITEAAQKISNLKSNVRGFKAVSGRGVEGMIADKKILIGNAAFMKENKISMPSFGEDVGRFEKAGDTVVYAACDGILKGLFVISDVVRDEAAAVIQELKGMGIHVSVISGDNKTTTSSIAASVGIDDVVSEASPVKKKEEIEDIQKRGGRVMMIGDGINDAPALTESAVGVAMGRGTDIAMESADAVLVRNDLRLIPYFIRLSKKTYSIIKQNIFWAFFYNIAAVPLAVSGMLHPIIAAGAMAASSLFVVGNSLRIRKY